jgi:hypothetical protein
MQVLAKEKGWDQVFSKHWQPVIELVAGLLSWPSYRWFWVVFGLAAGVALMAWANRLWPEKIRTEKDVSLSNQSSLDPKLEAPRPPAKSTGTYDPIHNRRTSFKYDEAPYLFIGAQPHSVFADTRAVEKLLEETLQTILHEHLRQGARDLDSGEIQELYAWNQGGVDSELSIGRRTLELAANRMGMKPEFLFGQDARSFHKKPT